MAKGLSEIMEPIQAEFTSSKEWQEITEKAYPPPPAPIKKKKIKDKGSRHPGAAKAAAEGAAQPAEAAKTEEVPIR